MDEIAKVFHNLHPFTHPLKKGSAAAWATAVWRGTSGRAAASATPATGSASFSLRQVPFSWGVKTMEKVEGTAMVSTDIFLEMVDLRNLWLVSTFILIIG